MAVLYGPDGRPLYNVGGDVAHDAVDAGNPVKMGGYASASSPTAVSADGDRVNAWLDRRGAQQVTLRDTTGAAVATGQQYVEDAALGALGSAQGTQIHGRANNSTPTAVSADGDAVPVWLDRRGIQQVTLRDTTGAAIATFLVAGDVAHDGVDSGNPAKIGGYASTAIPTAVSADGDRVNGWFSRRGSLAVMLTDFNGNLVGTTAAGDVLSLGQSVPVVAQGHVFNGATWERRRSLGALNPTGPNVDTGVAAAGIGPGYDRKTDPTGVPATGTSGTTNAVTVPVNGAAQILFTITTIGTGAGVLAFELSADDSTWVAAKTVWSYQSGLSGAEQPLSTFGQANGVVVGDWFRVSTAGFRQVRVRVQTAYSAGTLTVKVTGSTTAQTTPAARLTGESGAPGDANSNSNAELLFSNLGGGGAYSRLGILPFIFNGSTWDRQRSGGVTGMAGVSGDTAHDGVDAGNPLKVGGVARATAPSDVSADGDRVAAWFLRNGAQVTQQSRGGFVEPNPTALITKTAQYTSAQTGAALWTPAGGKRVAVTYVQIQAAGTTAGTVQLWFGASADTAYTRGTDASVFDGEFAPSATLKPGVVMGGAGQIFAVGTADFILRVTTSAAITITFTVWGYEI